jgi:RES domain-containing protein
LNTRRYSALCAAVDRPAFCHVPEGEPFSPRELARSDDPERWSGPGQPTIYLAGDVGVAIAELGRHTPHLPAQGSDRRRLLRVVATFDRILDLTRPEVLAALGLDEGPGQFVSQDHARAIATAVRDSGDCEGFLVPSVAFLDQPWRWNLVVFVERLRAPLELAIGQAEEVGSVSLFSAPRPTPTG